MFGDGSLKSVLPIKDSLTDLSSFDKYLVDIKDM